MGAYFVAFRPGLELQPGSAPADAPAMRGLLARFLRSPAARCASADLRVGLSAGIAGLLLAAVVGCSDPAPTAPPSAPARAEPVSEEIQALRRGAARWLDRARALRRRAQAFDADAVLRALPQNPKSGPVLRLDERLDEARIQAETPASRGPGAKAAHTNFTASRAIPLRPNRGPWRIEGGALRLRHQRDAWLESAGSFELARDEIGAIELRMRVARGRRAVLAWTDETDAPAASWPERTLRAGVLTLDLVPDGRFHTYRIDAATALRGSLERGGWKPGDVVRRLFLRPSDVDGDPVAVAFLRLVPKRVVYADRAAGRTAETLGGEMRSALFLRAPARLSWEVELPEGEPRLSFGAGILEGSVPVRFSASVVVGGERHELHTGRVARSDRWHDVALSLARFAGQRATLELRAASEREGVAFIASPVVSVPPPQPFHVIVLLEDTLRADRLSAYGHFRETSPAPDRLAARGVLFERAFAQATKTRASCPSFMTGLLPSATGVWGERWRLDKRFLTLPELLRSQGFRTASFVQNPNAGHAAGLHQGFDHLFDSAVLGDGPDVFGDRVLDWIDRHRDRNLFVYVHALDPHGVYDPPSPWKAWYRERGPGTTPAPVDRRRFDPAWVESPSVEGRRLLYDGEIRNNDDHLARFLAGLEALGILDHTLIVALSDHGESLGERGRFGHHPPGYVQVLHVPLILVQPGGLPAGRRVAKPVQLLDLAPTVLELAGVDPRGLLLQGRSLVALAQGDGADLPDRVVVSEEPTRFGDRRRPLRSASLFFRNLHVLHSAALESGQVFDLRSDPTERAPLPPGARTKALQREARALFDGLLQAGLEIHSALLRGAESVVPVDPRARERLRALGYLE
jgi:arylsulfatase A-like enzyme